MGCFENDKNKEWCTEATNIISVNILYEMEEFELTQVQTKKKEKKKTPIQQYLKS